MDARSLPLLKYASTVHLEGSRLQVGDKDGTQVPYRTLVGRTIAVEEKLDGANTGWSYDQDCRQWLQSRGHYLLGGPNEDQFSLFKQWARQMADEVFYHLEDRFLMYGEWLALKHTIFYDHLPHFFQEFDVLDRRTGKFLDTPRRHALLKDSPIQSVPVLYYGPAPKRLEDLLAWVRPSLAKSTHWTESLKKVATYRELDLETVLAQTEQSDLAEGLYIKVEENGEVVERLKWVRADFVQAITESDSHWAQRPKVPNQLHPDADLFSLNPLSWERLAKDQGRELAACMKG